MKIINLYTNGLGRYNDVSPFIIADNALTLKIIFPNYNGEFYLIANNNGEITKKLIPVNGIVALDDLHAGILNAEVKHYIQGELIKSYRIEPLLLKEVDGTISALPEIEALKQRLASLEEVVAESETAAQKAREELTERINGAEADIGALTKFAYEDFKENIYLGGGGKEEFTKTYGLEVPEENETEGENGND